MDSDTAYSKYHFWEKIAELGEAFVIITVLLSVGISAVMALSGTILYEATAWGFLSLAVMGVIMILFLLVAREKRYKWKKEGDKLSASIRRARESAAREAARPRKGEYGL